jgi:hypothetical protein
MYKATRYALHAAGIGRSWSGSAWHGGRVVHDERETALAAEILNIESYVMIRMPLTATIDLIEDLLDIAIVATGFSPGFPR